MKTFFEKPDKDILDKLDTAGAYAELMDTEDASVGDIFLHFGKKAGDIFDRFLREKSRGGKKDQNSIILQARMVGKIDATHPISYRIDAEANLEPFNLIWHRELKMHGMEVRMIGRDDIICAVPGSIPDLLESIEAERRRRIDDLFTKKSNADPAQMIIGSRRVFEVVETGHVIQMVLAMYPLGAPAVPHLLGTFFRSSPPNNPRNS